MDSMFRSEYFFEHQTFSRPLYSGNDLEIASDCYSGSNNLLLCLRKP